MYLCFNLSFLILLILHRSVFSQDKCIHHAVSSCEDCIRSGQFCAWCKAMNFTKGREPVADRCGTIAHLKTKGCDEKNIISPENRFTKLTDRPLSKGQPSSSEPVQLQPQHVKLELRPGQPHTFKLKFKRAEDYPVDLYYLMDLSYSMKDDLENVKKLGKLLLDTLKKTTSRARIGFGSFVDKTVLPFTNTNPEQLKKPCPKEETQCQAAFGYKHLLSMTDDEEKFNEIVSSQYISGNLDKPEGSLDAIMQAAVCGSEIGWGNSTRLLVLTTDDGFHMAGDGKLGSIFEPNDGKCHLDGDRTYAKNNMMDYPSVGQLAIKLAEHNIQPIFAVTENVAPVYKKLKEIIPKSEVDTLSNDSSNVITLIKTAYNKLSSNVIITHDELPDHITVTYSSNCPEGQVSDKSGICDNVGIGKEIVFSVQVTAKHCAEEESFLIGPLGFGEKMRVTVTTQCQCECHDSPDTNHLDCNKEGKISCGTCVCNPGYAGQRCECKGGNATYQESMMESCRPDNRSKECSGMGECICGVCQCYHDERRKIYGSYCECNDRGCEVHQNKLCGGHGNCDCDKCLCDDGYEGSACQCTTSTEGCMIKGDVCSGRGKCGCNACKCEQGYKPPFCETCPGCPSPCPKYASCIECQGFLKGPLKHNCSAACPHINLTIVDEVTTSEACRERDSENCWMLYNMTELSGFNSFSVVLQAKRECPVGQNIWKIVGSAFGGVALIGLLLLLGIKAYFDHKDRKAWEQHEQEVQKKSIWLDTNDVYKPATSTFKNPLHVED